MAARRRVVAIANGCLAVVAALALLLTPVTATTGAQAPHAHAMFHLLIDGADGSFDHHHIGDHNADGGGAHSTPDRREPPAAHAGVNDSVTAPDRFQPVPAEGRADDRDGHAAPPDDLPVVTALSVIATAAATPVADLLARLLAPAIATLVLAWGSPRAMAGIVLRPTSPPPRGAFGS